jgi:hypothetical protein
MAAMVRDQPEAEEDLPEMDRDLWDRDLRDSDLPATDRGQHPATDRREYLPSSVLPRREERLSSSV